MAILSKSVVLSAATTVNAELISSRDAIAQRFSSVEVLSASDKKEIQASETKCKYFAMLLSAIESDDRALSALFYTVKHAKVDPDVLLKEIASASYSLEKLAYLLKTIAQRVVIYDVSDRSAANICIMVEALRAGKERFTKADFKKIQDALKNDVGVNPDMGFTQCDQTLKLCERLGLVEHKAEKKSSPYAVFNVCDNDLTRYLKSLFVKAEKENEE
ncbi:hypothetical protein MWH03_00250 [Klebsiella pneumoniae]|nr:hypothetical protein [Klebsiella pneumoniae]